jgi:NitT/TauT family transport system substrate-binding protein
MHRQFLISILAPLLLAGCGRSGVETADGPARPLTKVVLQTDWFAEPEHGGFYEALAKGYYREAGLDVEIRQGGPTTNPATMVATGRADFGIDSSSDVILAADRGVPLVMIGAFMQRDPQAIMFHRGSGIHSFKDLDGRNIMAVPGLPFIAIMEKTFHIKVAVTPSDFGMSRFLADRYFVQQCFVTNEPYYVRRQGADVDVLLLSESGFSPYRVWYATRSFLKAHSDVAQAFGEASVRGWREYINGNPSAGNALIGSMNPKMDPEFMAYGVRAMQTYGLVTGDASAGDAIGRINPDRIAVQIRQLNEIGLLDRAIAVDDVFDPRFQP